MFHSKLLAESLFGILDFVCESNLIPLAHQTLSLSCLVPSRLPPNCGNAHLAILGAAPGLLRGVTLVYRAVGQARWFGILCDAFTGSMS